MFCNLANMIKKILKTNIEKQNTHIPQIQVYVNLVYLLIVKMQK
jgi:hypothetical protein